MKYSIKVFLTMSLVMIISFAVFGNYLLSSFFRNNLSRISEQGENELDWFEYIFVLSYSNDIHNVEKSVRETMGSINENLVSDENQYFVFKDRFVYHQFQTADRTEVDTLTPVVSDMISQYDDTMTQIYQIKKVKIGDQVSHKLICISRCIIEEEEYFLGFSKDISEIYHNRDYMIKQYQRALLFVLGVGGLLIFVLSQFLTKPIVLLSKNANEVANGNYQKRAMIKSKDEIGDLSKSINHMTDQLVEQMDSIQKQMEEKVLEAKQKEDFIAAFSHELKTPLTSIIGYADMLNSVELSEHEKMDAYYYIFSQGRRLQNLSLKLLELVSVEQNEQNLREIQMHDLESVIASTMRIRWDMNAEKEINGKIQMKPGKIKGDTDLLLSLFYNYLDNATKAIEAEGFIYLNGSMTEEGYEVKIVDNGRGIPKDEIARITEPFYMVDKSRSRKEGGAGIGLALCQKIVELHHAEVQIKSELGSGTVIRLLFPNSVCEVKKNEKNHF